MFRKKIVKDWGSSHLLYCGWYLDCPLDYTPSSKKTKQEKFDLGYLEKLVSSQANKEDINKRRKKKKDVQVSSTPRASQTLVDFENLDCAINYVLYA
jgi:hypothetical protein